MASSKEIEGGVASNHPEPVILPPERVKTGALGHVPNPDALVLTVAQDQLLPGVKDGTADIVVVAPAGVHLPSLVVVHPPQLDLPVIGPADDQRHAWVEIGPVHSPVMTLQHMLHNSIS